MLTCCTVDQRSRGVLNHGLDLEWSVCRMSKRFLIVLFSPLFPAVRHAATLPWRWDLWWWDRGEKDLWLGRESIQWSLWFWQDQTHGRKRYVLPAQLCICLALCIYTRVIWTCGRRAEIFQFSDNSNVGVCLLIVTSYHS